MGTWGPYNSNRGKYANISQRSTQILAIVVIEPGAGKKEQHSVPRIKSKSRPAEKPDISKHFSVWGSDIDKQLA